MVTDSERIAAATIAAALVNPTMGATAREEGANLFHIKRLFALALRAIREAEREGDKPTA